MDVLVLIDHLVLGGAEMLLSQFAAAAPSAGIRVSVVCLKELDGNPAAAPLRAAGVTPHNLGLQGRPGFMPLLQVRRHIAGAKPEIVHTHLGDSDLLGGIAARSLGVPVVSTIHTAQWDAALQTRARRTLVKHCAARVIAVSESASRAYEERGWAKRGQLVTIHNGVDVVPAPGAGAEVRQEFGWGPEHLVLGMVSALRPLKSHDLAIAAVGLLADEFPNLRLLIVGQGSAREEIERLADQSAGRVVMAGRREDVMRCLDAFDVCVHPSLMEAFPTTLIEAMAASVPVVATAVGGIPEVVSDGLTGILIDPPASARALAGALAPLLRDPPRRRAMGVAAREKYVKRFTAGPWIQRTRDTYDEVLAQAASKASRRQG